MNVKHCVSIDWLQVYCLCNNISEGVHYGKERTYKVELLPHETAMFKRVYDIYEYHVQTQKKRIVATMQCEPRSPKLNHRALTLKLANRMLYSQNYIAVLYDLIFCLGLTYKGITRIDVCYDCNRFSGGRSVPKFLHDYVTKLNGSVGYITRKGSDKFSLHGGRSKSGTTKITSMRFGSNQSRIGAYIYDKTLELQEVKDKPYIREYWEANGLLNDENNHVWRAEISIKSQGTDILNMSTGELFRLSPRYIEHRDSIDKLFAVYASKVLSFKICGGQKNKKDFRSIKLFDLDATTTKPYYESKFADTGRMERICVNKIVKLSSEYSDLSDTMQHSLSQTVKFLMEVSGKKQSIINNAKTESYLNGLRGFRYLSELDNLYMASLESLYNTDNAVRAELMAISPEQLYDTVYDASYDEFRDTFAPLPDTYTDWLDWLP